MQPPENASTPNESRRSLLDKLLLKQLRLQKQYMDRVQQGLLPFTVNDSEHVQRLQHMQRVQQDIQEQLQNVQKKELLSPVQTIYSSTECTNNSNMPMITGITTIDATGIPQTFPMAPQFLLMPIQPSQVIGVPVISQVHSIPSEVVIPVECASNKEEDAPSKKQKSMALTSAEKQRRYRERRRKDKEKEEINNKKDRERYHKKKKLINDMSEMKKRVQRESWRKAKAERKKRAESHADNKFSDPPEKTAAKKNCTLEKTNSINDKMCDVISGDEDCDKPLASFIGHPNDSILKKNVVNIVKETDLQDITINGVIRKVYGMYPEFDLSYRKGFIKSTVRSFLYKLGEQKKPDRKP